VLHSKMSTEQTAPTSKQPPKDARLIPLNLENETERKILHAQRLICGWGEEKIPFWREQTRLGNRSFFWVTLPAHSPTANRRRLSPGASDHTWTSSTRHDPEVAGSNAREPQHTDALALLPPRDDEPNPLLLVGHIAIDRIDFFSPPDESLAAPDGSILSLGSLFILPAFTGLHLGLFAMRACEVLAQQTPYGSPNCRAVTLTTLCEKYYTGGHMRQFYEKLGKEVPQRGNMSWYTRQGFVEFRTDVPRYRNDSGEGEWEYWDATFLRKELREPPRPGGAEVV
jgi:hypothetical protein